MDDAKSDLLRRELFRDGMKSFKLTHGRAMEEDQRFVSQGRTPIARPLLKSHPALQALVDFAIKKSQNVKSSPKDGKDEIAIRDFPEKRHGYHDILWIAGRGHRFTMLCQSNRDLKNFRNRNILHAFEMTLRTSFCPHGTARTTG